MSDASLGPRWRILLTPRWIGWHVFSVAAVIGMLWLGDWQLRRALSGNPLSWAYTFEWPIFAIFGVFFWTKTVRDELHPRADADAEAEEVSLPAGSQRSASGLALASGHATAGDLADRIGTGQSEIGHGAAGAGASAAGPGGTGEAAPDDTELAEYNAYLAKLSSQVKGHGRWHGLR
jgi:hypothetical protein